MGTGIGYQILGIGRVLNPQYPIPNIKYLYGIWFVTQTYCNARHTRSGVKGIWRMRTLVAL